MAPATRECPNCHATNVPSSSVCTSRCRPIRQRPRRLFRTRRPGDERPAHHAAADLDATTIGRIANQSNVDTVVSGSYMQLGDRIRIDAKIQDLKRCQVVTLKEEAAGDKEIFAAVDRLAGQIRENLLVSKSLLKEPQEHALSLPPLP
jgi:hypothetical protein